MLPANYLSWYTQWWLNAILPANYLSWYARRWLNAILPANYLSWYARRWLNAVLPVYITGLRVSLRVTRLSWTAGIALSLLFTVADLLVPQLGVVPSASTGLWRLYWSLVHPYVTILSKIYGQLSLLATPTASALAALYLLC